VTVALIGANVLAFLWQLSVGLERSVLSGGAIPYELLNAIDLANPFDHRQPGLPALLPPPLTALTSMFLHGGLLHLGGNMLFLWTFGNNVEDALGRGRFLLFYVATGLVAAAAQVAVSLGSGDLLTPMVGASGAVSGVLAAYVVLYPKARVLTLVPIFIFIRVMWLPASFFIGAWFVLQLLPGVPRRPGHRRRGGVHGARRRLRGRLALPAAERRPRALAAPSRVVVTRR
jgi:membrane associated rhomboid family serine protease